MNTSKERRRERFAAKFTDQWWASTQGLNDQRAEIILSFLDQEVEKAVGKENLRWRTKLKDIVENQLIATEDVEKNIVALISEDKN